MPRILGFLLFFTCFSPAFSQVKKDTLVLLNGDVVIGDVIDTLNNVTSLRNEKNAEKNFIIENDRIFAIYDTLGEHIMYVYDTTIGNEFSIDEMRYFIRGEQDAEKGFKARGAFYTNLAIGIASGITGNFLCPIPPFAFVALCGLPKIRIKHETVGHIGDLQHETYLMGYERVARKKRKLRSLAGGGIGLGVGLGSFFILKAGGNEPFK